MKIKVKITRQENADYFKKKIGNIIEVDFEEYVAAVVASEIGNSHIEACKAQAVAARSFAMSRNVQYGEVISDASSTDQAYRAQRYNKKLYPNSIQGTEETAGQVLFYNLKPAGTIYTASNGGRTVSSEERWGGKRAYLIAQDDPWDAAVGKPRNGSGVGMSQVGAAYAAKQGYNYKQILNFYYPNTHLGYNYEDKEGIEMALNQVSSFTKTLKKGMSGDEVVFLQNILNSLGYDCGTADGNFGKKTEAAVKSFQEKYGLKVDGIVGAKTQEKLLSLYKPTTPAPVPAPSTDNDSDSIEVIKDELLAIQEQVKQLQNKINALLK